MTHRGRACQVIELQPSPVSYGAKQVPKIGACPAFRLLFRWRAEVQGYRVFLLYSVTAKHILLVVRLIVSLTDRKAVNGYEVREWEPDEEDKALGNMLLERLQEEGQRH